MQEKATKNRIYKFRAWDKENKEMILDAHKKSEFYDMTVLRDYYSVMQYTGLKDKNGVEIYEGDIIKDEVGESYSIVWNKEYACFCYNEAPYIGLGSKNPKENCEVIGNIYENKDLLL